jgi:hypothetical protein
MKPSIFYILLLLAGLNGNTLWAQSAKVIKRAILDSAQDCTTNAYRIIKDVEDDLILEWCDGRLKKDFLRDFGTVTHECLHVYDDNLADEQLDYKRGFWPIGFFIDKNIELSFQGKEIFETADLHAAYFPEEVKKLFRYPVYIYGKDVLSADGKIGPSQASSNKWGLYGLLEEFNAYYHGANAQVEYAKCTKTTEDFSDIVTSYFEFNIFMAYYLRYAKEKDAKTYQYLLNHTELRTAYSLMELNWRHFLNTLLEEKAFAAKVPTVKNTAKLYTPELRSIMENFMLPRAQLQTYASFVKNRPYDLDFIYQNLDHFSNTSVDAFLDAGFGTDDFHDLLDETGSFEMSLDAEMREEGFYYVTVYTDDDMEKTFMYYLTKVFKHKEYQATSGVVFLNNTSLRASVFLKKFKHKKDAEHFAQKHKSSFPEIRVE